MAKMLRRKFLGTAGAALTGSALALAKPAMPGGSLGDEASQSPGRARLFAGCCAYSYRKYLQHGPMTMEDFIRKAVELRLDGVDMTAYYFKSTDPGYLAGLRHLAYKQGVPFSGAACGSSMVQADADKRAEVLNEIKKWVDVTDQLGASHLRIFAGKLPHGATMQQAMGWTVEAMKAASDYSGKKGVMVGVEDHSGVTQNAEVCLELMHRVNSPYAGINLDITHFIPTPQQDPYAQIEACIPYATNTHIRDHFDDGTPIDMDRVWKMFAQAGFKGYMSAEYEGKEDPATGVPKLIARIRKLCKKYSSV
ncbi:MAG TPA: sugar phosphate isomerase/epimerase family protein [Terriglobia bacterium]|nr:sugar phosphate isomerase/epimerase family protein [Terriglobia bacterium]